MSSVKRIGNGNCPNANAVNPRIRNGKCYGTGDNGYSRTDATQLPQQKNSPSTMFYGAVERLQTHIDMVLVEQHRKAPKPLRPFLGLCDRLLGTRFAHWGYYHFDCPTVLEFLTFMQAALPSANAYCYSASFGQVPTRHEFPSSFAVWIEKQTEAWASVYSGAEEFQRFSDRESIAIYRLGTLIREVEVAYSAWRFSPTTQQDCETNADLKCSVTFHGVIWNRLSTLAWAMAKRQECRSSGTPIFWQSQMPKCALQVNLK